MTQSLLPTSEPSIPLSERRPSLLRRAFRSNVLWLLMMFVVGIVVGSAVTILQVDRIRREMLAHPEAMIDKMTSHIRYDAGLNDAETMRIRSIVEAHHHRMMAIFPQIGKELDSLEKDVSASLTSEQRERWEPHFKRFRQHAFP